ncbi:signal peptide protein [Streptomyces wuyuanensis]|uniref:signal peptide protein n=1 Tax=Streptomyces wuyuanensis TaxID=1196353 RepID=UPI003420CED9
MSQSPQAHASSSQALSPATLIDFVDMPASPLPDDQKQHLVTVTYRNGSSAEQTAAPQLLIESLGKGPFLTPSDVKVERLTALGHWEPVDLGSQTDTLYTDLTTTKRQLPAGDTLTERYRLSVITPGAVGTVHPRVALFD